MLCVYVITHIGCWEREETVNSSRTQYFLSAGVFPYMRSKVGRISWLRVLDCERMNSGQDDVLGCIAQLEPDCVGFTASPISAPRPRQPKRSTFVDAID